MNNNVYIPRQIVLFNPIHYNIPTMNAESQTYIYNMTGSPVKPVNMACEKPETPVNHEDYPPCPPAWGQTCTIA